MPVCLTFLLWQREPYVCAALLADGRRAQLCAEAGLPHGLVKRDSFYSRPALPWAVEDRRGRRACAASSRLLQLLARIFILVNRGLGVARDSRPQRADVELDALGATRAETRRRQVEEDARVAARMQRRDDEATATATESDAMLAARLQREEEAAAAAAASGNSNGGMMMAEARARGRAEGWGGGGGGGGRGAPPPRRDDDDDVVVKSPISPTSDDGRVP